jgi:putative membrane protein
MAVLNILVIMMAVIHVYVFCLESILWGKPKTNRVFGVTDANAQVMRSAMFNQGFYNLFLAVALLMGFFWSSQPGNEIQAQTLKDYAALSILGAALVLWLSEPKLLRAVMIQGLPAAIYWVIRLTL